MGISLQPAHTKITIFVQKLLYFAKNISRGAIQANVCDILQWLNIMLAQGLFPNYNNYNINIPTFKIPHLAYFRSTKFLGEPDYVVVGGVGLLQQVPE